MKIYSALFCTLLLVRCLSAEIASPEALRVWLKADAITNLNNGDRVSSWPDSSGNGFNATNSGVTNFPLFVSSGLNGLPVVRFDGKTNYLMNTAYTHSQSNATLALVTKRNGTPAGYHNLLILNASMSAAANFMQIYGSGSTVVGNFSQDTLDCMTNAATYSSSAFTILILTKDVSGAGRSQFYVNGVLRAAGSGQQPLADRFYLGGWGPNRSNADIAEALIYTNALTDQNRQLLEGQLAWKYNLTENLPATHPYKNTNPLISDPPGIENSYPTNLSLTGVTLRGSLLSTGNTPTAVSVYWGGSDGGNPTNNLWSFTNSFAPGEWAAGTAVDVPVILPASNRIYYYRFAASNEAATVYASPVMAFLAGPLNVSAGVAVASESGTNGTFILIRPSTATNGSWTLGVSTGGTASLRDYFLSPDTAASSFTFPERSAQGTVQVRPSPDRQAEPGETITLTLLPGLYLPGESTSATVTIAASPAITNQAIAYWRFEEPFSTTSNSIGFLSDSSGGNHHLQPDAGTFNALNQQSFPYTNGTNIYGILFPSAVPLTGAPNLKSFWTPQAAWVVAPDSEDWTRDAFTVEAFVSPASLTKNDYNAILSHWHIALNQRSWLFGKPDGAMRLGVSLSTNGLTSATFSGPTSTWDLVNLNDYYVAFSFDRTQPAGGIRLYLKNLTAGTPLQTASFNHTLTSGLFNTTAGLIVNGYSGAGGNTNGSEGFRGLIDEVRISEGVLEVRDLLISRTPTGSLIFLR